MLKTINEWFHEQSQKRPDSVAISFGNQELSYFQLNAISDDLAHRLINAHVSHESRVGLCLKRSPELVTGILGILKAGAAYVPLDHEHPVERLAYMVQDAGIEIIVCDDETRSCFKDHESKLKIISITDREQWPAYSKTSLLPVNVSSDNAAYVIYTSGSTGQPKGCVVTHGNVVRLFQSTEPLFGFNETDVWTLFHSFAFDFSVWEIWGALFYGGRLVVVPYAVSRSPDEFLDLLIHDKVTVLNQTPTAFRQLIEAENSRSNQADSLRLRYIIFGGEGLDPRSLRGWVQRHGIDRPQLINMYGITETTVHVTYHRITSADVERGGSPIGLPLADLQVYLLTPQGELVPEGASGEIYVGGAGLARGYLNRPELSAERFVAPPFNGCTSDRLYRSGDLAQWNEQGSLDFLGRIDNQVKIRGHRIELGEIEAAISDYPGIALAAVIVNEHSEVDQRLIGYFVARNGQHISRRDLDRHLRSRLPVYMVPSSLIPISHVPLTVNGKLDRGALPKPDFSRRDLDTEFVAPANSLEQTIAALWCEVLKIDRVGRFDNFFALGGHSLLAMSFVAKLGVQSAKSFPVWWVFENPTIDQLAQKLMAFEGNQNQLQAIPIVDRRQPLPLSYGQYAMWLVHALLPDSATYNQPIAIRITGRINRTRADRSIEQIARRHESLRTSFVQSDKSLVQHICEPAEFKLNRREISLQVPTIEQQTLQEALRDEARRPFDLAVAPLWRVLWIELADEDHVLVLTFHHSIIDEWSVRNFCQELSALCEPDDDRQSISLPELPIQYADYAVWQRARQFTVEWEQSLAYWRNQLAELPPALELPTDKVRLTQPSGQGAIHEFKLSASLTSQLRQLARSESTTYFSLMLAAFHVWLARYSGHTDFIVGTPSANRERPEVQSLIGYFLNTLPIRAKVEKNFNFRSVLTRIHQAFWDAYTHSEIPFEQLVELAVKDREPGRNPIYQMMFVLLDEPLSDFPIGSSKGVLLNIETGTSKNDLTLDIQAAGNEWVCRFEYATDLFSAQTVARMADHFTELLRSIVKAPDVPIGELNLIGKDERHKILVEWNQTDRDYPRDKCLAQLFEEQVLRTPHAIAVEFEGESLSYSELNARANQLASYLRAQSVRPEMLVGVYAFRSLEMVVSLFGILKAGGAYVPIDPEYPAERVSYMLADSGVTVLLTQSHLVASLPDHSATVFCVDTDWKNISSLSDTNPETEVTPSNLAYMIYTSGSTGKPKGAMNTHLGIVNQLKWIQEQYELGPTDVVLQKTPFSFDVSVWEFFWPLLYGARLCVAKPGGHRDADYLVHAIQAHCVSVSVFVPSMLQLFLEHGGVEQCTSLRHVICIGEALSADLRDRFFARLDVPLHNLYGPAEAAVSVTHWTCDREQTLPFVPIGRPVANTQCYVLDTQLEPIPIGESGELYLGGVQVGRGYHNQPELTAQKFIPDPFQTDPDARLYKTGDLCRFLPDGNIQFLGRIDNQVKVRGFRIELDEIESILINHPDVSHCVASTDENDRGERSLVAYLVLGGKAVLSVGSLRKWLAARLPDYMIPSRFFSITAIPLSPNGKVDRRALKTSSALELESGTEYRTPRTKLEFKLAEIWQTILGRERISIDDHFLDVGGNSLRAALISGQIAQTLDSSVPLRWLFEYPTIEALARNIELEETELTRSNCIKPVDRDRPLPMSPGQQSMWLLQQLLPDSATYNQPFGWRFHGALNRTRVQQALQVIFERHEVLRTALVKRDGDLVQQIVSSNDLLLPWADTILRDIPVAQQAVTLEELLKSEIRRPFDLAKVPLWRLLWIELTDDEHILLFTFHHSIIDEWSIRQFVQEFSSLYSCDGDLRRANLPALPVQYADFAVWQRQNLTGSRREQLLSYWKNQLANLPPALELPSDQIQPQKPTGHGAVHAFRLEGLVVAGLRQLARDERMTLFTVLLCSFQVWLYRFTGQTDLIVGTPLADRERPEVQSLIGYFLNMLPIRSQLESDNSFRQVLREVHQTIWSAFSHADLPFEQMVELAVKERQAGRNPIYQVMFVLLEESIEELPFGEAIGRPLSLPTGTSKNDLTLDIQATGDVWVCRLEYATDLFSAKAAARMADHFSELLRSIAKDADAPIGRLNLMDQQERHRILVEWNQTQRDYPRDKCVHQLFEEQVQRTPLAVAVEFEEQSLTYRELNARANQLAHYLQKLGIGPETRVGICVDRSFDMIIGLLAILKAGGAYVPLDPKYPDERLNFLVADTGINLILTQRHLENSWQNANVQRLVLDADHLVWTHGPDNNVHQKQSSESSAYVIYTSGSTGTPKGVEVLHRGIVRLVCGADYVQLDRTQSVLQLAVLSFDASTFEIWGPLLHGGRCVLAPARFPEPDELQQLLRQKNVRTLWLTTSLFNTLVDGHLDVLNGIEQLLVGGEALSVAHIRRAQQAIGSQTQLINGYGPTESTTFACCHRLPAAIPADCPSIPIGRPISNTTAYVLDAIHQPVPVGVTGELYIGGDGLARGYLNQPELTAEKFLVDPFSDQPTARMYRTGDLVRWRDDGTLEFLGRKDNQVKIRGFRIEAGEIETVLLRHSAVRQAVVLLREDRPGDKRLVAYIVPQNDQPANFVNELRQYLHGKLPDYMIPTALVTLDNLPLTANGKVDKRLLPRPDDTCHDREQDFVPPRNTAEQMLARAWSSVLGIEKISVHDNFFELGGHSLLAVRVVDEIKSSMGIMIKVADLFRHATVAGLAESLSATTRTSESSHRGQYLESIRPGQGNTHLVIVGAKLRVPLEMLPPDIPVWWLKLDGLHVWPPKHLDLPNQAAIHAQELSDEISSGTIIFCGHSYGGLLAIEIAQQLLQTANYEIKLVLLEPSIPPVQNKSIIKRATQKVQNYKKRKRLGLIQEFALGLHKRTVGELNRMMISARRSANQKIVADDRWRYMKPFLIEFTHTYQLPDSIDHDIYLIKTDFYQPDFLAALNQIAKGAFSICAVSESLDHLDIADARHSLVWMRIVQQLIAEQSN